MGLSFWGTKRNKLIRDLKVKRLIQWNLFKFVDEVGAGTHEKVA